MNWKEIIQTTIDIILAIWAIIKTTKFTKRRKNKMKKNKEKSAWQDKVDIEDWHWLQKEKARKIQQEWEKEEGE